MFDQVPDIDVHAQEHPLRSDRRRVQVQVGATVAQIVAQAKLDPRYGPPVVILKRGNSAVPVPMDRWGRIRPRVGTQVLLHYEVRGAAVGALLSAMVSAAAPALAGSTLSALGITASKLTLSLATAAITVVGGLLISALIPPPPQPGAGSQDPDQFTITGTQNASDPYGIVPKPLGRRRIYPKKAARGYTVTTNEGDIEFRGRFVIGWGPVALSDIRIGTTPIQNFSGVEVEFLNVDEDRTFNNQPPIGGITKAWRQGTEVMTLYPDDVAEDQYNVLLAQSDAEIRTTRERTESADIDISFPQGLFRARINHPGERDTLSHTFSFRYRPASGGAWISAGTMSVTSRQNSQFRRTHKITFPVPGEWDVEVTQTTPNNPALNHSDKAYLSGIRSFRSGILPSHEGVAEIAIRVLASDQLNGTIDSLNMLVQQLVPIWNGTSWSAPQPSRHPAWILADALRGPHMRNPVSASAINLSALKDWADEEPHWTCDMIVEQRTRVRDVVDVICAAGRAKFALTDLKYSIIREQPSEPIRQIFTPRNSWGFKGKIAFPREIHALRCIVRSERLDWDEDEIIVYADGYNASNATEFEEIRFPGVVITAADADQGNVYKLGRYHLAVAKLRPETFEFNADFEHLQVQRGHACQIVHDVPVVGIGSARVKAKVSTGSTLTNLTIDDVFPAASGSYRITLRTKYGVIYTFTASAPAVPEDRIWTYVSGSIDAASIGPGDLLVIEETAQQSLEVLILGIQRGSNETALIRAVPRAPAVAAAATGAIPDYDPIITPPRDEPVRGPALPVIARTVSDQTTAVVDSFGQVRPRIAVYLEPLISVVAPGSVLELRWRPENEQTWSASRPAAAGSRSLFTGVLDQDVSYQVEIRSIGETGRTRGWVSAGLVFADAPLTTPLVPVYDAADTSSGSDILNIVTGKLVTTRWENPAFDADGLAVFRPRETEVWRSSDSSLTLNGDGEPTNAVLIDATPGSSLVDTTADYTTVYYYFLRAIGYNDQKSAFTAGREVTTGAAAAVPLVSVYADVQLIAYDAAGATPAPSSVTVTAVATQFTAPHYDFLVDGVSQQNGTSATFAYSPAASDANMPEVIRVDVREGGTTGSILASDRLTIDAYRAGAGTPILLLTNEAHGVPADSAGTVTSLTGAETTASVVINGANDTANWTISRSNSPGVSSTISGATVTVTGMTVDAGYVDIIANRAGYDPITKRLTLTKVKDGAGGTPGLNSATVVLYRKNTSDSSAPSDPSGTFTYYFSSAALTGGSLNGWSQDAPSLSQGEFLWSMSVSVASSASFVSVPAWQFTDAVVVGGSGTNGTPGLSNESVVLYQKNTSAISPPSDPTGTFTYTFATGALTGGNLNGWSRNAPGLSSGEVLWAIYARASSTTATVSIPSSQFGDAVVAGVSGAEGARGAGRWHIPCAPYALPTNSTGARTIWNANAGRAPVLGDQAFFYTGTQANPTGQAVFICISVTNSATHSWEKIDEVMDGNFLFSDSVTFTKMRLNSAEFEDDGFGGVVLKVLSAGKIPTLSQSKISNLPGDLSALSGSINTLSGQIATKNTVFKQSGTPTASANGDLWEDTATGQFKRWDGSNWIRISLVADSVLASWAYLGNVSAGQINAGLLSAQRVDIDGLTLTRDGTKLVISLEGVDNEHLAPECVTRAKIPTGEIAELDYDQNLTGATAFTLNSWTLVDTLQFTNDAEGGMAVWWNCICEATGTSGTDYTNYVEFDLRTVVSQSGGGVTYTKEWAGLRLTPYQTMPFSRIIPAAELNGRNTNPINVAVSVRITSRNPSSFNVKVRDVQGLSLEAKT